MRWESPTLPGAGRVEEQPIAILPYPLPNPLDGMMSSARWFHQDIPHMDDFGLWREVRHVEVTLACVPEEKLRGWTVVCWEDSGNPVRTAFDWLIERLGALREEERRRSRGNG